jgi:DNA-binding transcriptional LysR family regulator
MTSSKIVPARPRNCSMLSDARLAAAAGYSPALLLHNLVALSNHYGHDLVVKQGPRVKLTKEGEKVMRWAQRVLREFDQGVEWPVHERQELIIAASGRALTFMLPKVVADFLEKREKKRKVDDPGIDIRFREGTVEQVLQDLRNGEPHIAVCGSPNAGDWDDLDPQPVWENIPTVMLASRKHDSWGEKRWTPGATIDLSELAKEVVCVLAPDLHGALRDLPRPAPGGGRIVVDRYASVVALVQTGACIGFIPLYERAERVSVADQGLLVYDVAGDRRVPMRNVWLWRRKGEQLPEAAKEFVGVLLETMKGKRARAQEAAGW